MRVQGAMQTRCGFRQEGFRRGPFSAMNLGGREKLEKFIDFKEFLRVNEQH